jgi:hypothetical protein
MTKFFLVQPRSGWFWVGRVSPSAPRLPTKVRKPTQSTALKSRSARSAPRQQRRLSLVVAEVCETSCYVRGALGEARPTRAGINANPQRRQAQPRSDASILWALLGHE